jgi:hypothetical protein
LIFIVSLVGVVAMMFRFVTHAGHVGAGRNSNPAELGLLALARATASRSASIGRAQANFRTYGQEARTPLRTM